MLRELRLKAGLDQEQLAQALGCTKKYISNIECGRCRLSPLKYREAARALNISAEDLIEVEVEYTRSHLRKLAGLPETLEKAV